MRFVNVKSPVVFFLSGHVHLRTSDDHSEVFWDREYICFFAVFCCDFGLYGFSGVIKICHFLPRIVFQLQWRCCLLSPDKLLAKVNTEKIIGCSNHNNFEKLFSFGI